MELSLMTATLETVRNDLKLLYRNPIHVPRGGKSYYTLNDQHEDVVLVVNPSVQSEAGNVQSVQVEFSVDLKADKLPISLFKLIEGWFRGCPSIKAQIENEPAQNASPAQNSMPFGDGYYLTRSILGPSYFVTVKPYN